MTHSRAAVFGVGRATANKAHAEFTDPKIDDKGRLDDVHAFGVDENRFTNANAKHRTTFITQVLPGRRSAPRRPRGPLRGHPDGEVATAWLAKELLRGVYGAGNEISARDRLVEFYQYCAEVEILEITRLARTIDRWSDEVLAYHRTGGAPNGPVENMHMLAEKLSRTAHGFRNHDRYRRRLLGRLGIKLTTVPVRRIRGRKPRSAA